MWSVLTLVSVRTEFNFKTPAGVAGVLGKELSGVRSAVTGSGESKGETQQKEHSFSYTSTDSIIC